MNTTSTSQLYPLIGRRKADRKIHGFNYNSIEFSQNSFNLFAGLNTVDNIQNVEKTFKILRQFDHTCTRMGAFKPRTSPYSFQGHGAKCLPYVFELAGKYGIKVIAMEITHESQLDVINHQLAISGNPTGIIVQIGTRNTQNFELLKAIGAQHKFPILLKRGFGITLKESLYAAEYLAHAGNKNIVFCLRGVKSLFAETHRNLVDFSLIPVILQQTNLPVCIDPSHAIGHKKVDPHGMLDIFNITAQGIIAGANMLLLDVHPTPHTAIVDKEQTISLEQLPWLLEDIQITRNTYNTRKNLANKHSQSHHVQEN